MIDFVKNNNHTIYHIFRLDFIKTKQTTNSKIPRQLLQQQLYFFNCAPALVLMFKTCTSTFCFDNLCRLTKIFNKHSC